MAYRVRGKGMDREIERRIDEKYSLEDENELMEWIIAVLSEPPESSCLTYPEGEGKEVSLTLVLAWRAAVASLLLGHCNRIDFWFCSTQLFCSYTRKLSYRVIMMSSIHEQ